MKTAAKIEMESSAATELPQAVDGASARDDAASEARSSAIRYVDDKTFQQSLKKVFTVYERLLAKLAE
jgi:hypothetical protein